MSTHVNETARHLAEEFRRYLKETADRFRARGKHIDTGAFFDGPLPDFLQGLKRFSTPARKTAALGAGASLLLTGTVYSVAEAATVPGPSTVMERQLVNTKQLQQQEEPPAEPAPEAPAEDGAGSTAPIAEEVPPAKPSVPVDNLQITSPFGWRLNPITGYGQEWHTGTDFRGALGAEVRSARDGTVVEAGWHTTGGGGLRIVVDHGGGVQTTYNHLNDIWVEPGQQVGEGQVIGGVGSTGASTGPHLHFEVIINGEYIDPMSWL